MAATPNTDSLRDLTYAMSSLATSVDMVHDDLRRTCDAIDRKHDLMLAKLADLMAELKNTPISCADRMQYPTRYQTPPFGMPILPPAPVIPPVIEDPWMKKLITSTALKVLLTGGGLTLVLEFIRFLLSRGTL